MVTLTGWDQPVCLPNQPCWQPSTAAGMCWMCRSCSQQLPLVFGGKLNWGPHDSQKHILWPQPMYRKKSRAEQHQKMLPSPNMFSFSWSHFLEFYKINWSYLLIHVFLSTYFGNRNVSYPSCKHEGGLATRRWTKSTQWSAFVDQHVRLTRTLLLGFTPGLSSQLLCESLMLNLSRVSRLQVQVPSAFHHLLLATFSSCGPLTPIVPHFFSKNFPIPCAGFSPPLLS